MVDEEPEMIIPDNPGIRDLLDFYDNEVIQAFYGPSQTGKTTFLLWTLAEISHKTGKPALIYDTEAGANRFWLTWKSKLREKYPKCNIHVIYQNDIGEILRDHGSPVKFVNSAKDNDDDNLGKIDIQKLDENPNNRMVKELEEHKYCAVLYDSVSAPLAAKFGSVGQNYPARNAATNFWLNAVLILSLKYKFAPFVIAHASKNPQQKTAKENMFGGKAMLHPCKLIVKVARFDGVNNNRFRKLILKRHFNKAPNSVERLFHFTDDGPMSVSVEEMDKIVGNNRAENKKKYGN